METKIKLFCNSEHLEKIEVLSMEIWQLAMKVESEESIEEKLSTYTPIAEILKQASWLLDIASNISYYQKPF